MMSGRIILLGSTDLTVAVARRLHSSPAAVVGIVSTTEVFPISYQPAGMYNSRHVDIEDFASSIGAAHSLYSDTDGVVDFVKKIDANLLIACGWHRIVPSRVRELFAKPCLGLHASILPKYRGGAPLNWAILNGDKEAGVSIFELSGGVDDGQIYGQTRFPILTNDYIGDLVLKSEVSFLELLDNVIPEILANQSKPSQQSGRISYSLQRSPEDGNIDWGHSAREVSKLVRVVSRPYPGAFSVLEEQKIIIWRVKEVDCEISGAIGQIAAPKSFEDPIVVAGEGAISILEAQFEDGSNAIPFLMKSHNRRFDRSCR